MSRLQRLVLTLAAVVTFWGGAMSGAFVTKYKYDADYRALETEVKQMHQRVREYVDAPVECITFDMATSDQYGRFVIGKVDIYGRELELGWPYYEPEATEPFGGSAPRGELR